MTKRGNPVCRNEREDTGGLTYVRFGVVAARKGWLTKEHVLNTRPLAEVLAWLSGRLKR